MSYRCYCFPWSVVSIAFIAYVMFSKRGRQWQHLLLRPAGRGIMRRCRLRIHWKAMATFVVASCGQGNHAKMQVKDSLGGNGNVCCCVLRGLALLWDYGCRVLPCLATYSASKNYSLGDMAYRLSEDTFLRHNQRKRPTAHKRLSTRVFHSTLTLRSRRRGW